MLSLCPRFAYAGFGSGRFPFKRVFCSIAGMLIMAEGPRSHRVLLCLDRDRFAGVRYCICLVGLKVLQHGVDHRRSDGTRSGMHRGRRILEMSDKVMLCRIIQDLGDTNDLRPVDGSTVNTLRNCRKLACVSLRNLTFTSECLSRVEQLPIRHLREVVLHSNRAKRGAKSCYSHNLTPYLKLAPCIYTHV